MATRRHRYRNGVPTATFEELNYQDQARAISGTVRQLESEIRAHIRRAIAEGRQDAVDILEVRRQQVLRLTQRLLK